jgi:monothiol glutaredoxin
VSDTQARIRTLVESDQVVLFMKGSRVAPRCGFSATVVEILDQYVPDYTTVDVLSDPEVRDGAKEFSSWPTFPQLYVRGEFVGGCDIVRELDARGELVGVLGVSTQAPEPPEVTITDAAAKVFRTAMADVGADEILRLQIDAGFHHDLSIGERTPRDVLVTANAIALALDVGSARRARGLVIDYVDAPEAGFKMDNPNAPPSVRQLLPRDARALLDAEPGAKFVDVRTPAERERAQIEGTILLEPATMDALLALPPETPLVFHCHHGQRSHQAALFFLERGFRRVYNVVGGIDAWSRDVDPAIPRY